MTGQPMDCQHPGLPHQHGTRNAYAADRCRCTPCRQANRDSERERARRRTYGQEQSLYVDAGPSRERVRALLAAGVGLQRIAQQSSVGHGTLTHLLYGSYGQRQRPPAKRVRRDTEARLLAIGDPRRNLAPGTLIDATGTRRRLRALAAIGWSTPLLAQHLGRHRGPLRRDFYEQSVKASTAEGVRRLYDQLWDTKPPESTTRERMAASKARNTATRNGWRPPLAWDDIDNDHEPDDCDGTTNDDEAQGTATDAADVDDLDHEQDDDEYIDEVAVRNAMDGRPVQLSRHERDEAVRRLTELNYSLRQIAELLHVTARTVTRRRSANRAA
jgi:hypothetical protein